MLHIGTILLHTYPFVYVLLDNLNETLTYTGIYTLTTSQDNAFPPQMLKRHWQKFHGNVTPFEYVEVNLGTGVLYYLMLMYRYVAFLT